jgi:redox-sensitive bicupin YhaK (pirin superfamily)
VWDVRLNAGASTMLDLPDGHSSALVVLIGQVRVGGSQSVSEAEMVLLSREGEGVSVESRDEAALLVLTGEPIDEPIVGYGPFVMNSEAEIRQAIEDLRAGRFGRIDHT